MNLVRPPCICGKDPACPAHGSTAFACSACGDEIYRGRWIAAADAEGLMRVHRALCASDAAPTGEMSIRPRRVLRRRRSTLFEVGLSLTIIRRFRPPEET
jgi:hypothetical protein